MISLLEYVIHMVILTTVARHMTAGKPNADITMTLVINHIKSEHGLESRIP